MPSRIPLPARSTLTSTTSSLSSMGARMRSSGVSISRSTMGRSRVAS